MTIQIALSLLNNITSKYAKTMYDETTFHNHFQQSSIREPSDHLGRNFEDIENAMNTLIYDIQVNQNKFIYNDYDNLTQSKISSTDVKLYSVLSNFRLILDDALNHLNTLINLPILKSLDSHQFHLKKLEDLHNISYSMMSIIQFDTKFDKKVKMINNQLEFSFYQPKEKAFLVSQLKKLAAEFPILDENKLRFLFNDFKESYIALSSECKDLVKKQNPLEFDSMADRFIQSLNSSEQPIQQFLINKQNNIEKINEIKLTKSQQYQETYIFADNSIVTKTREGDYKKILGAMELRKFNVQLHADAIDYILRKRPHISKFFKSKFLEDRSFSTAINTVISFNDNETILKNKNVDLRNFKDKSFETIDDYINNIKKTHQVEQFAGSILSSKYKHLLSDNTFNYFETLYESKFSQKELQMYIGKKLAAIKNEDDMIQILQGTINLFSGFSIEKTIEKLEEMNIKPIINENNILIFEVISHYECQQLGSPSWCIYREDSYFEQYTSDGSRQYICYDFNKDESSHDSMLGFTYTAEGELHTAHYKNDDYLDLNSKPELQKIFEKALYLNNDAHQLDNERLKDFEKKYSIKKNKNRIKLL